MEIRILTYNTFLRPYVIKTNEDDYKQERLEDMISAFKDFDILCLQECFDTFSHRQFELLTKLSEHGFKYVNTSTNPGLCEPKLIDGGIVVVSKFPIVESKFYDFGTMGQSDGLSKKGLLYCRICIDSGKRKDLENTEVIRFIMLIKRIISILSICLQHTHKLIMKI
jgi:endonuclease/exonuclease/phosphatase family metal-dependent hydrolase